MRKIASNYTKPNIWISTKISFDISELKFEVFQPNDQLNNCVFTTTTSTIFDSRPLKIVT
jgi:hypothetical protein